MCLCHCGSPRTVGLSVSELQLVSDNEDDDDVHLFHFTHLPETRSVSCCRPPLTSPPTHSLGFACFFVHASVTHCEPTSLYVSFEYTHRWHALFYFFFPLSLFVFFKHHTESVLDPAVVYLCSVLGLYRAGVNKSKDASDSNNPSKVLFLVG